MQIHPVNINDLFIKITFTIILSMLFISAFAQSDTTEILRTYTHDDVVVTARTGTQRLSGAMNGTLITRNELFKAACCNLGESFVTNPSVDVNYSDATTGVRQIKLLGLSGTYVQMLTENLPAFRGAAMPYALGYIPGPWMKSIAVSKGNSSVKNGYEAITGQIDVEYLKPQDDSGVTLNIYGNTMGRIEANADGNVHLGSHLSGEVLAHFDNQQNHHDGNDDGFQDEPQVRQYNVQTRWHGQWNRYLLHFGVSLLDEERGSGQTTHAAHDLGNSEPWRTQIDTRRYEGYMKHALVLNEEHGSNLALMGNVSLHQQDAAYGLKAYSVDEKSAYASLMYETNLTELHNLSVGVSINHDWLSQHYNLLAEESTSHDDESETTSGAYAQYTLNLTGHLVAMAGLRVDHSNLYGTFCTPRFHVKWIPTDIVTLRLSVGKGYRTPHALAEWNYLMASGRQLVVDQLEQEAAWNYGIATSFYIPLWGNTLRLNAEYYYTNFLRQTLIDYDTDPSMIHITNLQGDSYSHTFQVDANYPLFRGFDLTLAYRYNLVKSTYGNRMLWKPLQSKYKALASVSYKVDPMGLWQIDATLALNGGGRMPTPYTLADGTSSWNSTFKAFCSLTAQVTRQFRHFSVYIGGENLTNYKQKTPIIEAGNPWGSSFDPTLIYAPISGVVVYAGVRLNLGKHVF